MLDTEKLVLVQSSMQRTDSWRQVRRDVASLMELAVGLDWDVIAVSEATRKNRVWRLLNRAVDRAGWWYQGGVPGDVRFIVNPKHDIRESGYTKVLEARRGYRKGNYAERGIAEVMFRTPMGNKVHDHTMHWNTGYRLDRQAGHESRRERGIDGQTDDMADRVKLHGRGRRLSFWQGDTNMDEHHDRGWDKWAIHHQFRKAGLRSVFDELGEYPNTHHRRTIDIIGSYNPDRRVSAQSVRVLPRDGRSVDHLIVVAEYSIRTNFK